MFSRSPFKQASPSELGSQAVATCNYCECCELLLSVTLHHFSCCFSQLDVGVLGRGHGSQHGQAFTSRITPVPGA